MSVIAETRSGRLEGRQLETQVVFKGIPYAAPPVGPRRWLPPAAVEPWTGVLAAHEYGPACMQAPLQTLLPGHKKEALGEDCLYLNVWTPALDDARRPVMVWIHGGAFMFGSGDQMMREEQTLVSRGDVVLVSINYRLGPYGFLNLNEVTGGAIPSSGNEGLLDQVAALEWVRDNIAAFGGDPGNVTIFGESAGGMSVGALLSMPAAAGLFHKAIPQSGASHTANTPQRIEAISTRFAELAGTRDADALRALSAERVLELQHEVIGGTGSDEATWAPDREIGSQPFQPCVDGKVLQELPIHAVAKGSATGVPVLVGSTLDEYKAFVYAEPSLQGMDDDDVRERLGMLPGIDGLITAYRDAFAKRGEPHAALDVFAAIGSDRQFRIPAVRLAETQCAHETRVYQYIVTWPSPLMDGMMGATHGIDLGPVFDVCDLSDEHKRFFGEGPALDALTVAMQKSWAAFARTGNPACKETGDWPAYDAKHRATMMLGEQIVVEEAPLDAERRAWDDVPDDAIGEY